MNQHHHQAWASQQNAKITFCCLTKKSAENTGFSLLLIKETLLIKLPSSSAELRRHASIAISTPTQGFATLIEEKKGQQHSKLQCCQRHDSSTGYASLNMPISILFSAVSTKIECPPRMQSKLQLVGKKFWFMVSITVLRNKRSTTH